MVRAFTRTRMGGNLMTQVKRDSPRQQARVADDALNEALMATFPASDPLSLVNTLIPGTRDEQPAPTGKEACPEPRDPELVANARRQGHLANAVAFLLVLLAVLLMLDAWSSYPIDSAAATRSEDIVAVPPM
jgi:hypothetical protein